MTRLPFRDAREKGPARGPRPLFSFSRMTGCLLDTRLADGISKVFQEPSGVGTIITNHTSNKATRVTSWQKRSKTNSTMFLRDNVFKKKPPGWQMEVAYSLLYRLLLVQLETRATISCSYHVWTNKQSSPPGLPKERRDNQTRGKKNSFHLFDAYLYLR